MSVSRNHDAEAKANALRIAKTTTRRANAKRLEWTRRRDAAITLAHRQGASLREIGKATDLSHAAIKKIVEAHSGRVSE